MYTTIQDIYNHTGPVLSAFFFACLPAHLKVSLPHLFFAYMHAYVLVDFPLYF